MRETPGTRLGGASSAPGPAIVDGPRLCDYRSGTSNVAKL